MSDSNVVELFKKIAQNDYGFFARLGCVRDVMSPDHPKISCDIKFGQFIEQHRIGEQVKQSLSGVRSLAQVDPETGTVIGVLERTTILRCYPNLLDTLAEKDTDRRMFNVPLSMLATRPVPKLDSDASLMAALNQLLAGHDLLMIYDENHQVVGSVSPMCFVRIMALYYKVYSNSETLTRLRLVDLDQLSLDQVFSSGAQTARDVMSRVEVHEPDVNVTFAFKKFQDPKVQHILFREPTNNGYGVMTRDGLLLGLETPENAKSLDFENPLPYLRDISKQDQIFGTSVSNLIDNQLTTVEPTTRFSEILETMIRTEGKPIIVLHEDAVQGIITQQEALRIFRNLLTFDSWNLSSSDDPFLD